ncbi:MAG: hypothetical protein JO235_02585 [Chroococcidiopsidaceae cyanobacterium CP_BM_RX_35]|nr:hypothetical protein [Chroococcidiopsidaceae cyanobacterium CP_BM_RX_35]
MNLAYQFESQTPDLGHHQNALGEIKEKPTPSRKRDAGSTSQIPLTLSIWVPDRITFQRTTTWMHNQQVPLKHIRAISGNKNSIGVTAVYRCDGEG